jgi:hypothetical protein
MVTLGNGATRMVALQAGVEFSLAVHPPRLPCAFAQKIVNRFWHPILAIRAIARLRRAWRGRRTAAMA